MPEWDNWRELFLKGFTFYLVELVYLLPTLLFISLSIVILDRWLAAGIGTFALFLGFSLLLVTATLFLLPMSWAHFASTGRFNSIFEFSKVLSRIRSVFHRYLLAVSLLAVLWIILGLLAVIPVFGVVVLIIGSFYIKVVQALLLGNLYRFSG